MTEQHRQNFQMELQDAIAIRTAARLCGDEYLLRAATAKVEQVQALGKIFGCDTPAPTQEAVQGATYTPNTTDRLLDRHLRRRGLAIPTDRAERKIAFNQMLGLSPKGLRL